MSKDSEAGSGDDRAFVPNAYVDSELEYLKDCPSDKEEVGRRAVNALARFIRSI